MDAYLNRIFVSCRGLNRCKINGDKYADRWCSMGIFAYRGEKECLLIVPDKKIKVL